MLRHIKTFFLVGALSVLLSACSHNPNRHPQDPLEGLNREFFGLNKTLDRAIIKPVAFAYLQYLPDPLQMGVGNFFDNLREIPNVANDILQFKFAYAAHDASRFLINTTVGILGFFDPAGGLGLEHRKGDFGQTLYHWGYKKSAYLVLPLIGPTTIRDAAGLGVDYAALSVWPWVHTDAKKYALLAVDYVDLRARILRREPVIDVLAVDEYVFYRDAYLQYRQYLFEGEKAQQDNEGDDVNPYENEVLSSQAPNEDPVSPHKGRENKEPNP